MGVQKVVNVDLTIKKHLTILEPLNEFFLTKRVYAISSSNLSSESNLGHAHKELNQIFFALGGNWEISLCNPESSRDFLINEKNGLFVPAGLWRNYNPLSRNSFLVVLASEIFFEGDYIRDWNSYLEWGSKHGYPIL